MLPPFGLLLLMEGVIHFFDFFVLGGHVEILTGDAVNFAFGVFLLDAFQSLFVIFVVAFDAVEFHDPHGY